jgi:hypothetical protein
MPYTLRPEEKIKYFYYVHGHTILYLLEAVGMIVALWLLQ